MTSAPLSQQRQLVELQRLDSQLARLAHERSHLPVLARIQDTVARLRTNRRDTLVAQAALSDAADAQSRSEDDVEQVVRRAGVLRERLASGAVGSRDLTSLQGEIDQLGRRQTVLEEAQIQAMEALEEAHRAVSGLTAEEESIRAAGRELTAERDAALARIDEETERLQAARDDLAGSLDQALVAEYDDVRASTGGIGVVALYGQRVEGSVEISPQEHARILAAPQDAVIHAADNDVILVRMEP